MMQKVTERMVKKAMKMVVEKREVVEMVVCSSAA
jgi:hypothetical protein